jgi:hypothetical protein
MTPPDIRDEQRDRPQGTIKATGPAIDQTALMVMALSLACTALAVFDLLLLAASRA